MDNRILVIDDEKAIRNSFLLTFENSKFKVDTASSGLEGLDKLLNSHYDLVFLDLKMPSIDGVETLRRIRKFNTTTVIYIFTAFHRDFLKELEEAATEGLDFEIAQKPLDGKQLIDLVTNILTNK